VLAREASGYHSVETIFQRLAWGDDVRVRITSGRSLECRGDVIPPAGLGPTEKNLAFRAASAYADATGWPSGFAIEIDKVIPVGGGLGGGSADAGAVLRVLDSLSPNPLGARLVEIAAALGADVPFMAIEHPLALAWSRGERLFPLASLAQRYAVLVVPDFAVETPDAYGWLSADRGDYAVESAVLTPDLLATWESLSAIATNDFERVVSRRHPQVAELVDELASFGAIVSMMSGSGSVVFGIFGDRPDIAAITRSTNRTAILAKTADRVSSVERLS
jgi:4-diphosphocytidyl-2-C-methyl-D-erythritol kinase